MPEKQITVGKKRACQPTAIAAGQVKLDGAKRAECATGSDSSVESANSKKPKKSDSENKSLLGCEGQKVARAPAKLHRPRARQTTTTSATFGLYHRKCFLPIGRGHASSLAAISSRPQRNALIDKMKTSGLSTCPPTFRIPVAQSPSRKSLSMIDLSSAADDQDISDLRSESSTSSLRNGEVADRTMDHAVLPTINSRNRNLWLDRSMCLENPADRPTSKSIETKAASTICHLLAINAWRRRREEVFLLQENVNHLSQEIDNLHLQIVVLRRLLNTENCRVEKITNEARQTRIQLEDANREKDSLKTDKHQLEDEMKKLRIESEEKSVKIENLKNDSMTMEDRLQRLDLQMSKEREKLLKLREDKKILLEKISSSETLAGERGAKVDVAEAKIGDLQGRLTAQENCIVNLNRENSKFSRDLKAAETERLRLEHRLRVSEDSGKALAVKTAKLETQLSDREAALRRIESAYSSQMNELTENRERLIRQSQEGKWSSRMLQIAGSVVWAPRAILRSLSFLSNSQ